MTEKSDILNNGSFQKFQEEESLLSNAIKTDDLIAGIAHDLNNILTTIAGYAEMLQEDLPWDSPGNAKAVKIIQALSRAKSLVNQILIFGRHTKKDKIIVNVNDILIEITGFVNAALPPEISLNSDIPQIRIPVFADPLQLYRIFLNLMTNAVASMEEKGGILDIGVRIVDGDEAKSLINRDVVSEYYVIITFKDTGCGIDTALKGRIFEPYFTTREGMGTGLGLSVVREIINDLDGRIFVSSKEKQGSVFEIYLPVYKEFTP